MRNNIFSLKEFKPKKYLGQNFLISENTLNKIINLIPFEKEVVLEIGAGIGNLTQKLALKAEKVIAIEIDKKLCEILRKKTENYPNIIIIQDDILKLNLEDLSKKYVIKKIIGNLPYSISNRILRWLLNYNLYYQEAYVMLQKEVARRLIAFPSKKEYGILSIVTQFYTKPEIIIPTVSKENFFPKPKVSSSLVKLLPLKDKKNKVSDEILFLKIVKNSFAMKRKKLINCLNMKFKINKLTLINIFNKLNFSLNIRAENLNLEEFIELTNEFKQVFKF